MAKNGQGGGHAFTTLDVFTSASFSGNPLAVVWDADDLTTQQMQHIAAEFGYSETVFVLKPSQAMYHAKLRIFTPTFEIDFAGHPTIGAAIALAHRGAYDLAAGMTLEENAGEVAVTFAREGETLSAKFQPPILPNLISEHRRDMVGAIGHQGTHPIVTASAGTPFAFVQLADEAAVDHCTPGPLLEQMLSEMAATGVFVFAQPKPGQVYARMFAPDIGVLEDPATGSAVAALAAILWHYDQVEHKYCVRQGVKMGRPSKIGLQLVGRSGQPLENVYVSGSAIEMMRGTITGML